MIKKKYNKIIVKVEDQKKKRLSHEAYLKHFVNDLKQEVPLWACVDLLTIADISILYSISEIHIKKEVAAKFKLTMKSGDNLLGKFMKSMTIIRNLCAHGSRLFNRLFEQKPSLSEDEKRLLIKTPSGTLDNAHLYGFILIMRRLLSNSDFLNMENDIINIKDKYPFIRMSYYGFRTDWKTVL